MNVRRPRREEFESMAEKGRGFWYEAPFKDIPYDLDSMVETFCEMHSQGLLLVAYEGNDVIGGIGAVMGPAFFNRRYTLGSERFWWLDSAYRRTRAGLLLITGLEAAARTAGCHYLSMLALEATDADRAEFIYRRLGFEPTERMYLKRM